jgi:soluble lytic murein transglycosylase-like protein
MIMGYMKVVLLSLAAMSNILPHKEIKIAKPSQKSLTLEVKVNKGELAKRNKIKGFIKLVNPKYSDSYIAKIVDAIFKYSKKYQVNPYIIASTAYVESEFSMKSRPCIGIMQILRSTARYIDPKRQYDPYTIDGNIALGAKELSMHLKKTVRGSTMDRSSGSSRNLRYMWGKYNGAGTQSRYSSKVLKVLQTICMNDINHLRAKLKHGPIW